HVTLNQEDNQEVRVLLLKLGDPDELALGSLVSNGPGPVGRGFPFNKANGFLSPQHKDITDLKGLHIKDDVTAFGFEVIGLHSLNQVMFMAIEDHIQLWLGHGYIITLCGIVLSPCA